MTGKSILLTGTALLALFAGAPAFAQQQPNQSLESRVRCLEQALGVQDRKSTRLNSSH